MKKLLLATALTLAMSASAMAGTINLQLQEGILQQQFLGAVGQSSFSATNASFGSFLISNISGATTPTTNLPVLLSTNTLDVQQAGTLGNHILQVWITANNLTSPTGVVDTFSLFTNVALSNGWAVTLETLFSATDQMFAGTLIDTANFLGGPIPQAFASNETELGVDFGNGPYSLTAHYTIITNGVGEANSGITLGAQATTPLPAAVWMFGSALGLGGLIMRRRKKKQSVPLAA